MPRPKPPEELLPVTYRLTRKQIRKVQSMGGVAWLRDLISRTSAARHGRDPVEYIRDMAARNREIIASPLSGSEIGKKYNLSKVRINQIRREHRNA